MRRWVVIVFGIAAAYFLTGRLAMLLALPPGYASPIFPPSGIALGLLLVTGYRHWFGILLGSYLLNLWIPYHGGNAIDMRSHLTALGIASGATFEALLGTWLIRRVVGYPSAILQEREIFAFLMLGGPVSCLVNALLGPLMLAFGGAIRLDQYWTNVGTWWFGDSLGVLIFTPLLLTWFGHPKEVWQPRRITVALPLVLTFSLVTALFAKTSELEDKQIQLRFNEQADDIANALRTNMSAYIEVLHAIERLQVSSAEVSRQQFHDFVTPTLGRLPGFQALEWIPRIPRPERETFERRVTQETQQSFEIRERDSRHQLIRAGDRAEYFPVLYAEPVAPNRKAFGYDIASDPARLAAINSARLSGQIRSTRRIELVQGSTKEYGLLVMLPVYADTTQNGQDRLRGMATGVFRIRTIVETVLSEDQRANLSITLTDPSAPPAERQLYSNHLPHPTNTSSVVHQPITLGDHTFTLTIAPGSHSASGRAWQAWIVMTGGLAFVSLLGAFLLSITGRATKVSQLVEQRTHELRSANDLVKAIVDNAIEAIITVDEYGRIESFNPAAERLFGHRAPALLGEGVAQLKLATVEGQRMQPLPLCWASLVGSRKEIVGERMDGSPLDLELAVGAVQLGTRRLFSGIFHDLADHKRMDRMKSEFISTVSHELRTPLTSIRGTLELVSAGVVGELPPRGRELIEIAAENSRRLADLINDILDIEKIEFGDLAFTLVPLEIGPIVREAITAIEGYAAKFSVTVTPHDDAREPVIATVDKTRLVQALNNLLSNAIKYSPVGGHVEVDIKGTDALVLISVRDHGEGIPEEFRSRIFGKFAQADASDTRARGGTGLGLAITKAIVDRMGGRLDYESVSGQGSTFIIELPRALAEYPPA